MIAFLKAYAGFILSDDDPIERTPQSLRPLMMMAVEEEKKRAEKSKRFSELGKRGGQASVKRRLSVGFSPPNGFPEKKGFLLSPVPPINIPKKRDPSLNPSLFPALNARAREEADGFEAFWEKYPKKTARERAKAAWESVADTQEERDEIMTSLDAWNASAQWGEEGGRFIPKAHVFLEERRYKFRPSSSSKEQESLRSFEVDDFFEKALRKSYGA